MGGNSTINIDGYEWYGHNRLIKHKDAPKMSGGVGILVKSSIVRCCDVNIVDKSIDGILGITVTGKETDFSLCIFVCYLPPESSVWGRDGLSFFAHLISQLYVCGKYEHVIICGDFNARLGNTKDFISEIDNVTERIVIDNVKAGHSEYLIDFLKDARCIIMNGRITPEFDNYTCVSPRGKSVVDYFIIPHDQSHSCSEFKVELVSDIIERYGCIELVSERCKPPDHSMLEIKYKLTNGLILNEREHSTGENENHQTMKKRYKFNNIPNEFMNNEHWMANIHECTDKLIESNINQYTIDNIYDKMCDILLSEMDKFLDSYTVGTSKNIFKHSKPYWTDNLSDKWQTMKHTEKDFLKCK